MVATKTDKLSANRLRQALAALAGEHGVDNLLPYSAKSGAGRNELWRAIRSQLGA